MIPYEQAVIGAIMLDPLCYYQVADMIGPEDFTDNHNRTIFLAIERFCKASKPVDAVTMGEEFPEYVNYLYDAASSATTTNVRAYADEVRKSAEERRVKLAGQKIATSQCSFADAQKVLSEAAPKNISAVRSVREYMKDALMLMQDRCDRGDEITGLSTGLDALDDATSGLHPGTLVVVAARPSMGKTAFSVQLGTRTALRKKRVAVFEMEMTGVQLSERAVSLISGVHYGSIRRPKLLQEHEWPKITQAFSMLEKSELVIDDSSTQRAETICARTRQLHMKSPLSMVIIDHLGLIDLPGKGNPVSEVGQITKAFKGLAKDLQIPVILLVQLNRQLEQRADKRPMLSDLRESGRIEEDADVVMMLYRDDYYNPDSPHKGFAECIIRKNRDGETCTIPLRAELGIMKFSSCEGLPDGGKSSGKNGGFGSYAEF